MPSDRDSDTGRPEALHTLSDADKAAAISAVCKALTGQPVDARIEMIDYDGRLGPRGPFRYYSTMRFALFAKDSQSAPESLVDALQQIDDETFAKAIATALGKLAGEDYQGYIAMRRIGHRAGRNGQIAEIRIQLATA
jgi:hypothetical protein